MIRALMTGTGACLVLASPASAQHAGHGGAVTTPPTSACTAEHAAMGHCVPTPPTETGRRDPAKEEAADPQAAHATAEPPADSHAGHAMPHPPAAAAPPVAPPPRQAFSGPENAGAAVWDPALFERKRRQALIAEHGGYVTSMVVADQLEYRARDGRDGYKWDLQGWYGGDHDKLWLKSEGEGEWGRRVEQVEVQALYSRAIDPWFNLQAGIRHDLRPDPDRTHAVIGIQGLAPYWFEVEGALFLSNKGDLTARIEAEYDQRITNRLILQPAMELDFAAQDIPELGIGAGLSSLEAGLRLRYEIVPEFAPYVGVEYERAFGNTADARLAAGEDRGGYSLLTGIRLWF